MKWSDLHHGHRIHHHFGRKLHVFTQPEMWEMWQEIFLWILTSFMKLIYVFVDKKSLRRKSNILIQRTPNCQNKQRLNEIYDAMMINFSFKTHNNFGVSSTHQFQISSPTLTIAYIVKLERLRLNFPPIILVSLFWHFSIPLQALALLRLGHQSWPKREKFFIQLHTLVFMILMCSLRLGCARYLRSTTKCWLFFFSYLYPHSFARRVLKGSWLVSRNVKNRSFRKAKFHAASSFMFGNKLIEGCSLSPWRIFFWLFI